MKKTYLFYDIETTGLNFAFDQVLQFAAIRTDEQFNEIKRYEFRVKLRPDVLPSPYALITHLISIKEMQEGQSELEVTKAIHQLLNEPGTVSLGYNTLGFDDEFLRFSFYRNLLPPYTHQYANNCGRMDILPLMPFYFLFSKNTLNWPYSDDKLSLKLEKLIVENALAQGQAHDAIVDVEATLALTKKLMTNEKMWQYCHDYFNKAKEMERLQKWRLFETQTIGLYVDSSLGVNNQFMAPVMCLGQHWHYKNQWLFLRLDQTDLQKITLDTISDYAWVFRKKMTEPGFFLPFDSRYAAHLSLERQGILQANQAWLLEHPKIFDAICAHYLDYKYPVLPEADVDSILYQNGFLSQADEATCREFHAAKKEDKKKWIGKLSNTETQELAKRLLARNNEDNIVEFKELLKNAISSCEKTAWIDYRGQRKLSIKKAKEEIAEIRKTRELNDKQKSILSEYETWLLNQSPN